MNDRLNENKSGNNRASETGQSQDVTGHLKRVHGTNRTDTYGGINPGRRGSDVDDKSYNPTDMLHQVDVQSGPAVSTQVPEALLPPVRTLLVLSMSYLFIYTSYNGIQNIQSSINDKGGLGVITLASVYTVVFLFCFTQAFVSCSMGVEWVGFVMMAYGTSTAVFATVANYLARHLGRVVLMITFIMVDSGLLVMMLLWTPGHDHTSTIIIFTMAAAEGVSEGISQPQFNSIISIVFRENLPPAFVVYFMIKCLSFSISLAVSSFACLYHRLYLALSLYALGLVGYVATEIMTCRRKPDEEEKPLIITSDSLPVSSSDVKI